MQGVPETDDIRVQGQCHIGANWIYASLLLAYDVSALKDGDNVEVVYVGPGYRQSHDARVIKQEDGIGAWGIEIVLALDDPVWQVLRRADAMTYQVPGGEEMTLDLAGSFVPVSRFVADCARIGDL